MRRLAGMSGGNNPREADLTTRSHIRRRDEFTPASLAELCAGHIDLIWHRAFYGQSECAAVLPGIVEACEAATYTLTNDLQSLGTSIGEANESDSNATRYFQTAMQTTRQIRQIFGSQRSPADTVRLQADEWWESGAMVGKSNGQLMLPNIIRRWPQGGQANPHIDQREIPLLEHYALTRRIGVNVYLETPQPGDGGEIEFWQTFREENAYRFLKRSDYGLDRDKLGEPHESILPGQGDLILFDAARVHGVRQVREGSRVTSACFLGVRTPAHPLVVFA